ncbi:polysaccharide biosynthesis/export family protein [Autumnicola psychrophila]|uniref:Polysaccharide biosynthesis/export family protein n=1 Tax=Autumnicola psychrophila TaxID=3075592 RepID=A0ABU3DQS3_9FLAO|nr:polysaccharide biosynthesis/export family protein [Zunongwangia sp. F225]MDT0686062.1 polysaccharide biosynthesis/export family protein [Zunongwangia sp. F225]
MKFKIFLLLLTPMFFSCGSRDLSYFNDFDSKTVYSEKITNRAKEPVFQTGDLLSITVTSQNPKADVFYNKGALTNSLEALDAGGKATTTDEGYLVDRDGNIEFPSLGNVQLAGLTKRQAKEKLSEMLTQYLTEPIVNIRYLNFKVTVIGEVTNPSTFNVPGERINIIQALGMAGDMTVFGKRENVLIIQETDDTRHLVRVNLNDKELLNSPYFYLQPNDVIYVEPVTTKKEQASMVRNNISLVLSVVSLVSILLLRS